MFYGILIFAIAAVLVVVAYFAMTAKRRAYEADEAPEDRLSDADFRRIEFGDEEIRTARAANPVRRQ